MPRRFDSARRNAEIARVKGLVDLKAYADDHLERRSNGAYVCPACGCGTHANRTACLYVKGQRWRCYSASCGEHGDVLALAGLVEGLEGWRDQLQAVADYAGADIDEAELGEARRPATFAERAERERRRREREEEAARREEERAAKAEEMGRAVAAGRAAHAEALRRLRGPITDPAALAYLAGRGIDAATAERWGLAYVPRTSRYKRPRIVIPYPGSDYYHVDRAITPGELPKYYKWPSAIVGPEPMWNPAALESFLIVVMEGQLDALAVAEYGYESVSTGGSGKRAFLAELERTGWYGAVLLLGDSDEIGQGFIHGREDHGKHVPGLAEELAARGLHPVAFDAWPVGNDGRPLYKDAQEWWQHDPEGLGRALAQGCAAAGAAMP